MEKQPYLWNLVIMGIALLLTACDSTTPVDTLENSAKQTATVMESVQSSQETQIVEVAEGNTNSPLPTPGVISTAISSKERPSHPTQTLLIPTSTTLPVLIEIATVELSSTKPSEPIPSENIVAVGGYEFSLPQETSNTRKIPGIKIVDWLPGSSHEVLLHGIFDLGILNITTGEVTIYATVKEPGNIRFPVWVPAVQGVAYLSWDIQTNQQNLWLSKAGNNPGRQLLSDVAPPLIPLERGLAIYSQRANVIQEISLSSQNLSPRPSVFNQLSPTELERFGATARQTAIQPNGDWIAVTRHNSRGVQFFNPQTEEAKLIDLGGEEPVPLWAMNAKWSPDGQKLALIVTQGIPPVNFSDLYILDWPTTTFWKVDDSFAFVNDTTWAPDSKHLLFKAFVGQKDGFNLNALYIIDVSTTSEIMPVSIPNDGLSSGFGGAISWSPDGQKVLLIYSDDSGSTIYQMEVIAQ